MNIQNEWEDVTGKRCLLATGNSLSDRGKGNDKISLCLIKYHAMKMYIWLIKHHDMKT